MSLLAFQRDFRSWLMSEAPDAAARFGEAARSGLAVYINNYRGGLMACLAESYPTLRAWLGHTAFDGAAAAHIDGLPPHDWTLDAYGLDFPSTVTGLYPDDPEVGDLARLERDLGLAFVGPDCEQLDLAALADIDWDSAVLGLVPTFRLLRMDTNAAAIWSAINAGKTPPPAFALGSPETVALWRHGFTPRFRTLAPMEAPALAMALEGRTFAEICAAVASAVGEDLGPSEAGGFLAQWIGDGFICRVVEATAP